MKILYITTISNTMEFFPEHIKMLQSEGNTVELACHMQKNFSDKITSLCCKFHEIPFSRNPLSLNNIKAYKKLKKLLIDEHYDIIHTHTPNASVCIRLVARHLKKDGLKVIYTAHGFHFYRGAPLKNWLLYYPVEKLCSHWTDALITINHEDYELAKNKMHAKKIYYVPGVGIDVAKFANTVIDIDKKRTEIGVPVDAFLLLSVGELNKNKNHEVIIRALAQIKNNKIHYIIAGQGKLKDYLEKLAYKLGVGDNVHLFGFRLDIAELYKASDVCCFPSIREGLGLAALEGMASGLPLIATKNRGTVEYTTNSVNGFLLNYNDITGYVNAILKLESDPDLRQDMASKNAVVIKQFNILNVKDEMARIYLSIVGM